MTDRDLAIARAALEAAASVCNEMANWPLERHPCATITDKPEYLIGIERGLVNATNAIRAIDPATIVAGVPPRHKAERVMDELNHHALDENQRLAARVAELEKDAARWRWWRKQRSAALVARTPQQADALADAFIEEEGK